jgi:hypothetical protein
MYHHPQRRRSKPVQHDEAVAGHDLLVLALFLVQLTRHAQENRRKLLDGGERRAKLVRDMRQKFIREPHLVFAAVFQSLLRLLAFGELFSCRLSSCNVTVCSFLNTTNMNVTESLRP